MELYLVVVGTVFVDCCGNSVGTGALFDIENVVDIGNTVNVGNTVDI